MTPTCSGADDVGTYVALYAVGFNEEGQPISAQYGQPGILVEPLLGVPTLPARSLYSGDEISVTFEGYVPDPVDPSYDVDGVPRSRARTPPRTAA